jgi:ubiquitin-protein ligase
MDSLKNRILKEYEELQKNKTENAVEVWLVDDNIRHWKGKIKGPVNNKFNNIDRHTLSRRRIYYRYYNS